MSLPDDVRQRVESFLDAEVESEQSIGGGCIANATRIDTRTASFFLKWSRGDVAKTFRPEAAGLAALRTAGSPMVIPQPLHVSDPESDGIGILLIEWVESGRRSAGFWEAFGRALAQLHRHTDTRYGFEGDNFIGRLPQRNTWRKTWTEFFVLERLEPQVRMARTADRWEASWDASYERLVDSIGDLLPSTPEPSILHGDLWSGNVLVASSGRVALVDPAVYYGDREADLGMTKLFGGFDASFYSAYEEAWPLSSGHEERMEIYNLYHLINHLNHFGAGYASSVEGILRKH